MGSEMCIRDSENGIHSFPSMFSENTTTRTSVQLTLLWFACFAISDPINQIWFLAAAGLMCILNITVILSRERLEDFQTVLFRISMLTGWVLLASIMIVEPAGSGLLD